MIHFAENSKGGTIITHLVLPLAVLHAAAIVDPVLSRGTSTVEAQFGHALSQKRSAAEIG